MPRSTWLLPAMTGLLDQAHAVAFLRCLKGEVDTGKVRKVFEQLVSAAKGLFKILWGGAPFQPRPGAIWTASTGAGATRSAGGMAKAAECPTTAALSRVTPTSFTWRIG